MKNKRINQEGSNQEKATKSKGKVISWNQEAVVYLLNIYIYSDCHIYIYIYIYDNRYIYIYLASKQQPPGSRK